MRGSASYVINNILLEKKKISEDVRELNSTVNKQQTEIVNLKKQLTKSATQLAAAEKELDEAKKRINDQQEEIGELYDIQDRLEQYTRKNFLMEFQKAHITLQKSPS